MKIVFHKNFQKKYVTLPLKVKEKIREKNTLFIENPYHEILNNHPLHGKYEGYRSINVTGDVRIIYKILDKDIALFSDIGTYGYLYK